MSTLQGVYYAQQKRRCNKKDCGKCPHGPYWYAFWRDGIGRKHSKYIGKELPADVSKAVGFLVSAPPLTQERQDWLTLGMLQGSTFSAARASMRQIVVALNVQWKNASAMDEKLEVAQEIAAVRLAFRRLFPGRR